MNQERGAKLNSSGKRALILCRARAKWIFLVTSFMPSDANEWIEVVTEIFGPG